ncbi:serine/threonine-protein kinase [Streptomyces sp. Go-475]|uniref:serine/threonine-protein kinase n=1 Tax=Streptomyces sp. Go-475 TaxID=2072505 RepID=UPI000DF01BB7|nr:serine/threonine-protein kinase [Streptomyces sp. Go-475]AXE87578.1 Serine/threonine-protein kinase AfsK [Streptomyces sp. Go-475]
METLGPGDPQRIGAYRLLARLGAGGMGHVYLARSERGRTVAVKLVREELAAQEEFRERFRQEVQAARRVGGYWTAPVLDADTEAAVPWVATGYVAGPSLQQVVGHDHGALPERTVRILAAGLAHALQDIHAAGIVHRDLKPSNVLVTIDGPRVIDFGIARALETVTDGGLTRTGALVGSPGFMAPEQVRGDRITPACDVFCLGSVLAYAATGNLPFGTANSGVHALMFRIAQEEPDLEGVPEGIADLVRDCLRKDPAARPTLDRVLERTGADDTVADGRALDPWLPSALVAQLGRHAVRLLDAEDPEGEGVAADGPVDQQGSGSEEHAGPGPDRTPEHAPAVDESAPAPVAAPPATPGPPPPRRPGEGPPLNHLPTMIAGQDTTAPPPAPAPGSHPQASSPSHAPGAPAPVPHPHTPPPPYPYPAYGHPQQHPQPGAPAGGAPSYPGYGGLGSTPPYGPPPYGTTPPYGPPQEPRRNGRSTALLVVIALVVALAAGGSVYALMQGGEGDRAGGDPTPTQSTDAPTTPDPTTPGPSPTTSPSPPDGAVPTSYLGTWTATIDNADGQHSRSLTIQQGEPGDTVLSLVADGPTDGGGTYHCVFEGDLTAAPDGDGPLKIGPSTVTVGQPRTACTPGAATEITLLPDGTLQRVNTNSGERLTYTRQ